MATINIGNLTFTHRGDYDGSTAYAKNDVVYYGTNGNAYIAKQATTGNVPTNATYWSQYAAGSGGIWNGGLSLGSAGQIVKVNSGGNALEFGDAPSGKVKQAITKTASYDFGTIGNDNNYHISQLDITFTAQETDPLLFLSGEVLVDDSDNSSFGVDLGFKVVNNTDSTDKWAYQPNQHPFYIAISGDKYFPCRKTVLWDASGTVSHGTGSGASGFITAGDSITIQTNIRGNNSNMRMFGGNNSGYHSQWTQVWEIK